jgi:hypothetical protein
MACRTPGCQARDDGFQAGADRIQSGRALIEMRIRDLAARCARVMLDSFAQRGRAECRVPNAPAASRANGEVKHTSVVTTGSAEITRHSRTQWF